MPRVVTGFLFALSADSRKFYSAMRQARKGANEVEKAHIRLLTSLHRATRGAREFVKRVVSLRGALTTLAGGGAIGAALRSVTDFGAALSEGADRVGLSIEDYQALGRVFEGDGLAANNFQKAMERLSRTILDANQGLSTATRAFETLGVAWQNEDGTVRDLRVVLEDLAGGFARLESQTAKVGLAQQIFGTRATAVLNVLNRGRESLRIQTEEMRALGVVSEEGARTLKELAQDFTNLANIVKTNFANAIAASSLSVRDLVARVTRVAVDVLPTLTNVGLATAVALTRVADSFFLLAGAIAAVKFAPFITFIATAVGSIPNMLGPITAVSQAIATWIGPIGWIALAVAGLITFNKEIRDFIFGVSQAEKLARSLNLVDGFVPANAIDRLRDAENTVSLLENQLGQARLRLQQLNATAGEYTELQGLAAVEAFELKDTIAELESRLRSANKEVRDAKKVLAEQAEAQKEVTVATQATATAVSQEDNVIANTRETFELLARAQREVVRLNGLIREDVGTALPAGLQQAADKAEQLNEAFIGVAGRVAGIEHDIALAGTAAEGYAIRLSAIARLERDNAEIVGKINEARLAGNQELVTQLEGLLRINDIEIQRLSLTEQQRETVRALIAEEQEAQTVSQSRWENFKRIGADAIQTVGRSLEQFIVHAEDAGEAIKRLAVLLAATAVRDALFTAIGIPTRHEGGPVRAGRLYSTIPGEAFIPAVDGQVIPRREVRMGAGASTTNYSTSITISGYNRDPQSLANEIVSEVERRQARRQQDERLRYRNA